jgi:chromosome segregation ATPase
LILPFGFANLLFEGLCHCLNISYDSKVGMSFGSHSGSRRDAGAKFQKGGHEKKSKAAKKQKAGAKYLMDQAEEPTLKEVAEKAVASFERLGNQTFALSPFSQYYDDWLVNLRHVVSEFEASPNVKADEAFLKEREQAFLDVQSALAERRLQENTVSDAEKALHEINHELGDADADYAEKTRGLSNRRNADVQRLTNRVHALEEELATQQDVKISFYKFNAKKEAAKKLQQTQQDLTAAKNQMEVTLQNFTLEQDKLHDSYVAKKQELSGKSDALREELEQLETDTSVDVRKEVCTRLSNSVNALIQRLPAE